MAEIAINAITLGLSGFMSIPLLQEFFPTAKAATTVVTITAGQVNMSVDHGADSIHGTMPNVALFDVNGGRVGFMSGARHGILGTAQSRSIYIDPISKTNNVPPEYISISARSSDAVCIAYIAITGPNSEYWTWNGEFGAKCNQWWYPSNQPMGGTNVRPPCIWLSNDGRFPMGFAFHAIDFSSFRSQDAQNRGLQFQKDPDSLCKSVPRQHFYPDLTELNCIPVFDRVPDITEDGTDADFSQVVVDGVVRCDPHPGVHPTWAQINQLRQYTGGGKAPAQPTYGWRKRELKPHEYLQKRLNLDCNYQHLVVSHFEGHSAQEVCQSETSSGPDFVSSTEGLFCDMCTHLLWPLCSPTISKECFDLEATMLRSDKLLMIRDGLSGAQEGPKNYTDGVQFWK